MIGNCQLGPHIGGKTLVTKLKINCLGQRLKTTAQIYQFLEKLSREIVHQFLKCTKNSPLPTEHGQCIKTSCFSKSCHLSILFKIILFL